MITNAARRNHDGDAEIPWPDPTALPARPPVRGAGIAALGPGDAAPAGRLPPNERATVRRQLQAAPGGGDA